MKVGHFVEEGLLLETPSQVNAFHVVVENPTFSPLGVLICALFGFSVNSLVLLYRTFKPIVTLRLYLIPNDNSVKYAVEAMEKGYGSSPIWKPAKTKPLYYGYSYVVSGSMHKEHKESLRIIPEEMEFSYMSHTQVQSFAEIYIQEKKCVELFLENKENHDLVWKTWLEPEEIEFQEEQSITSSWKEGKAPEMTISDHLKCTLENLKDKDFKQFKRKLNEFPFKKEFKNIPSCNIPFCELENADALEVSHLLIKYYTEDYAVEVTTEVLKAISCNQQANDLLCATNEITAKLQGTGKRPGLLLTRGSSHSEEAKEDLLIKTSPRTARKRFLDSVIMIRKGRKHITEILKEDQELFLDELLTQSVITKEEHEMLDKMEADSKKKSRQLLIWIQEKEACVQFLDCMEMFYPGSVSSLQSLLNAQDGNSVETVGQLEEQSDSSPGDYR